MNDDFRVRLIKIRDEKLAHRDDLVAMKNGGVVASSESDPLDIDGMIAHEQTAIDNLDDAIARLG